MSDEDTVIWDTELVKFAVEMDFISKEEARTLVRHLLGLRYELVPKHQALHEAVDEHFCQEDLESLEKLLGREQPPAPEEKTEGGERALEQVAKKKRQSTYTGPRSVIAIDLLTGNIKTYQKVTEAAKELGVNAARISEACTIPDRVLSGRVWRYVPKPERG